MAVLNAAQKVLQPVALAILLAFILSPAAIALQRRGLGRISSVLVVVTLAFLLLGGLGYVITRQITSIAERLPDYQGNITNKVSA